MPGNFRQMSQMFCLVTVLVIMAISPAWSAPEEDLITDLPYLTFTPTFRQYSGYLRALDGKMLHYWFIESENSPQSDPLVLWLNGGPGCSSLFGLLGENGPLRMVPERAVEKNPFGWTKVANMLYLEAPAGVGFSFSKSKDYSTNDDDTAINNFAALKDFFRKFPEYKDHDFYISGESYAGYYIPTLVSLIIDSPVFNLKGFFIGNSFSSATLNSDGKLYFIADHGLISQQLFTKLLDSCCPVKDTSNCSFSIRSAFSEKCRLTINEALRGLNNLDPYNIYAETTTQSENSCDPMLNLQNQLYLAGNKNRTIKVPTCELYGDSLSDYLNLPEVRRALHIPQEVKTWVQCADFPYETIYLDMYAQYQKAMQTRLRIMLFNGDVDSVCCYLADEWFVDALHAKERSEYKQWFYQPSNKSKQVGGYYKAFKRFTFATVRGSGHYVPKDRPLASLTMFKMYLDDEFN